MTQNVWQPWNDSIEFYSLGQGVLQCTSPLCNSDTLSRSGAITGCLSCCVLNESSWCIRSCLSSHWTSGWSVLLFTKRSSDQESFTGSRGRSTTPNHPHSHPHQFVLLTENAVTLNLHRCPAEMRGNKHTSRVTSDSKQKGYDLVFLFCLIHLIHVIIMSCQTGEHGLTLRYDRARAEVNVTTWSNILFMPILQCFWWWFLELVYKA